MSDIDCEAARRARRSIDERAEIRGDDVDALRGVERVRADEQQADSEPREPTPDAIGSQPVLPATLSVVLLFRGAH